MAMDNSCGQINRVILASFMRITSMGRESIAGRMDESMTANGLKIKCKAEVYLLGLMADGTRVNISMIKRKDVVALSGQMAAATMGTGEQAIKRVLAFITMPRVKFVTDAGRMVREHSGYQKQNSIKKPTDTNKIFEYNSSNQKRMQKSEKCIVIM